MKFSLKKELLPPPPGFTLIELLVVIAIIGLLSTLAVVALGTARLKSRDARRVEDLKQIQTALELYAGDNNGVYPPTSSASLGDSTHACLNNLGFQPTGCTGTVYMANIPKDPKGGYYAYSGTTNDYSVKSNLEGAVNAISGTVCVTSNQGVSTCPCPSTVVYSGQTYTTVLIGSQCWFRQNLNVYDVILADGSTAPSDNTKIEKWCWGNNQVNNGSSGCDTGSSPGEGGLYTWAEANQLPTTCDTGSCSVPANNQGICPSGWHIPSDQEFQALEIFLGMSPATANTTGDRGTQGLQLSSSTMFGTGTNSSGFTALLGGERWTTGTFNDRTTITHFWLSSENSFNTGWSRFVASYQSAINRGGWDKRFGFSVRCVMN